MLPLLLTQHFHHIKITELALIVKQPQETLSIRQSADCNVSHDVVIFWSGRRAGWNRKVQPQPDGR